MKEQIGEVPLTTGATACIDALTVLGAKRIGVLTPYQPIGDENVLAFFTDMDFEVRKIVGLKCATATSIAHTPRAEVFDAVRELDAAGVDAIVQVGTNLSAVDIFPTLERQLGKQVIPINIANAWAHAAHARRPRPDRRHGHPLRGALASVPLHSRGCRRH